MWHSKNCSKPSVLSQTWKSMDLNATGGNPKMSKRRRLCRGRSLPLNFFVSCSRCLLQGSLFWGWRKSRWGSIYQVCVCVCVAPWEVTFQKWSGHSEWCPFLERCIQEMSWFLGFFPSSWSLIIWTRVVLPTLPSCAKDVSKVGNCIVMWPFNGWARENTRSTRIHSKPNLTWPPRQQKHQKKIRDSYWFFTLQLTSQWKIFKTVVLTLSYFESTPPPYFTVDKQSTVPHLYEGAVYPSFTFYCYRLGQLDLKSPPSFWMFTL